MAIRRVVLLAIGLALCAFAVWLPINLAWGHAADKAVYGATFGAVGVIYGFIMARYWGRVHERPSR